MSVMFLLFDVAAPGGGKAAVAVGLGFLLVLLAVAYVAFRLLKKTVKMAVRMAIVAVIVAIAIVGSVSLWWFGSSSGGSRPPRPSPTRR